jgi:hypothetical protein
MKNTQHLFNIIINTEMSNIIELIKSQNIYIYIIIEHNTVICAYFYRKTCIFVEKEKEILSCFASINNTNNNDIFIKGFKISFWEIANKYHFGYASIEEISHNSIIIENIIVKTAPEIISPTAYFFYNFAYPTFHPKKVFILN